MGRIHYNLNPNKLVETEKTYGTHYEMKGKKVHYGILDEQFSEYSYGLRPKRYAVMAITKAIELMNDGNDLVDLIHSKMKGFIN